MAEFSIRDVAFTGFRVVRQHPRALLAWWLYSLGYSLLLGVVFVSLAGSDFVQLMSMSWQPTRNPAPLIALLGRLAPAYGLFLVLGLASNAIVGAAMIRAVVRPHDERFGYLRLGADELRQLGLLVLTFLVFMGVYLAVAIVTTLVAGILVAVAKGDPAVTVLVLFLGVAVAMLFLAVRLSLAGALTFDTGRINLFGSWSLTRGRFWRLSGAYLLAFALAAVVYVLSLILIFLLGAILNGGDPAAVWATGAVGSLEDYFAPARLAQTVLGAGVSALITPLIFTPAPAIYRLLSPSVGEAFA